MDPARRQAYLGAMGIQAWVPREARPEEAGAAPAAAATQPPAASAPAAAERAGGFPADMLRAALRGEAPPQPAAEPRPAAPAPRVHEAKAAPPAADLGDLDWPALADRAAACRACALHQTRTQAVFGVGDRQARLMIVGEAPGADEDRQGEPFVGRAGQLLNAMLAAIGLTREQVYIANILKCRPPGNRDPEPAEAAACRGFLNRQIALLKPELILSLGAVSAHNLLATDLPVGKLRGRWHQLPDGTRVAVSYHPAYLLRRPEEKTKAWQDLQRVAGQLRG